MNGPRLTSVCAMLVMTYAAGLQSQTPCTKIETQTSAIEAVSRAGSGGRKGLTADSFTVSAIPQLTTDLLSIETNQFPRAVGHVVSPVCFYEIELSTFQLEDGRVEAQLVELDRGRSWVVAVANDGKTTILTGDGDETEAFNALIARLKVKVTKPDDSLAIVNAYLSIPGKGRNNSALNDSMALEVRAIDDFRTRYPQKEARGKFDNWWKRFLARNLTVHPMASKPLESGFLVSYTSYDSGRVLANKITVHSNGSLELSKPISTFE
jgi:hypothetical protein